jgi:DUF917 family protein
MRAAPDAAAVIDAAIAATGGRVVASGPVREVDPLRTAGGFDHGSLSIGGYVVRYLNEYMTVDLEGLRVATYPDVIATLSLEDGRPISIAEMTEGREAALFVVDQSLLPLSSSTRDRFALEEVEKIMGISLIGHGVPATRPS